VLFRPWVASAVSREKYMFGCYAPKDSVQEYVSPITTYPAGLMMRGRFFASGTVSGVAADDVIGLPVCACQFVDDDGNAHGGFEYKFCVTKDWDPTAWGIDAE
jgi:hypothetical protein